MGRVGPEGAVVIFRYSDPVWAWLNHPMLILFTVQRSLWPIAEQIVSLTGPVFCRRRSAGDTTLGKDNRADRFSDWPCFLSAQIQAGRHWDEISAAKKLKEYRAQQPLFRGTSFESISAFGSNGAVIHYTPKNSTKLVIDTSSTYLLDSGGTSWLSKMLTGNHGECWRVDLKQWFPDLSTQLPIFNSQKRPLPHSWKCIKIN